MTKPMIRLPDFIILGAQKSATSWLHKCLRSHPQIFMPRNETSFFEDPDYKESSLALFAEQFHDVAPQTLIGIKRPTYLSRAECAPRIAHDLPKAKLLFLLRMPVQRAISATFHLMRMGIIAVGDPDRLLNDLLDRYPEGPDPHGILYFGRYAEAIASFAALMPPEQRLVLLQTDIRENPAGSYRDACDFLGINADFRPPMLHCRVNTGVYGAHAIKISALLSRGGYRRNPVNDRIQVKEGLWGFACTKAIAAVQRATAIMSAPGQENARITPATEQRLLDYYRPDIERLSGLIGRDLSSWTSMPRVSATTAPGSSSHKD